MTSTKPCINYVFPIHAYIHAHMHTYLDLFVLWDHYQVKWGWLEHKHCDPMIADLLAEVATEWLKGGEQVSHGDSGQRGRCPFWVGWSRTAGDFINLLRTAHHLTLTSCLILEISIQYFQIAESETANNGLLLTGETGGQLGDPQLKQLPKDTILRIHVAKFC